MGSCYVIWVLQGVPKVLEKVGHFPQQVLRVI